MADLTKKVEALERQLDTLSNVFDYIQKSLTTEKRRHSVRIKSLGGRPEWVEEIVRHFNKISAELKSFKETLNTSTFINRGNSPSDASATNTEAVPEAELQHGAPSQRQGAEQVPPAISENRHRESGAANGSEPVRRPSSPPGQNIMTKELPPQAHLVPGVCEVSITPSTSTEPLSLSCQPNFRGCVKVTKRQNQETRFPGPPLPQSQRKSWSQQYKVMAMPPNIIPSKRKAISAGPQSRTPLVMPHMGNLLESVCGREAFHCLCSLIHSWRDRSKPLFEIDKSRILAVQLVNVMGILGERSLLTEFLNRFARVKLAETIDNGMVGRLNADPRAITILIRDLQWEDTRKNRDKLHNYLKDGRRWKRICGQYAGLLCLIPPNREDKENLGRASGRMYQALSDDEIRRLHSLLDSNQLIGAMCRVGNTFQTSLWDNAVVPEFVWEGEDPKEVARLPLNKMVRLIKKFQVINANECHFEKHDWPKPDCWHWDWPQYPTWVPPSDKLCDLCDRCEIDNPCNCITECLPHIIPEITNEGKKGQGVRAIGTTYRKGQILGEFLGELVPLDTYHDGWPIEFRRPDLGDEPVAQIYPKEMGNWVRKVNHSCAPSAEFREMKISCWWRQMIVAIEDILLNGEVTASCGRNFLQGQGKECFCDVHN